MKNGFNRRRVIAALLFFGAGFMFYLTVGLVYGGAVYINVWWVVGLLFLEMALDIVCMIFAGVWLIRPGRQIELLTLRITAAIIVVHAVRVLIFVIGRVGPWIDFDVRPEYRQAHSSAWTWSDVYIAGSLASLSVIALFVFWGLRRSKRN